VNKISGKQDMNKQTEPLNPESHGDRGVVSEKESKDGKLPTLIQKTEVLSQYFCMYLAL